MKTILSIIEMLVYNLLPPVFADQVITIVNDMVPLIGIAFMRIGLHFTTRWQYLNKSIFQKPQAKLFKLENIFWIHDRIKRLRA